MHKMYVAMADLRLRQWQRLARLALAAHQAEGGRTVVSARRYFKWMITRSDSSSRSVFSMMREKQNRNGQA
jgi:hypothetical protein